MLLRKEEMLINMEPKSHFGKSAKSVKVNIPNNNHYHELSKFECSFPVMDFNNMTCNHEKHPKWQVAGKEIMNVMKKSTELTELMRAA